MPPSLIPSPKLIMKVQPKVKQLFNDKSATPN